MKIALTCIPCIINNYKTLLDSIQLSEKAKENSMKRFLAFLAQTDFNQSPPAFGREIHKLIRETLNNSDPYQEVKEHYNRLILGMYPELKKMVEQSNDKFQTALRLAIAGNAIDFGSQYKLDVMETINRVNKINLAIDDSASLYEDLQTTDTLLYIGDNCGEIVFDKLFLEYIKVPNLYFAVRGDAVINDVTFEDAVATGIDEIANIITTGDNSPGAVWEYTSAEFKDIFNKSDVIISKGQGNYEGLSDVPGNIYFLFISKCDFIADKLGVHPGDFIIKQNGNHDD